MAENNDNREIAEIVENALTEFRKGMEYREQLSIRIGRRTTQIIRFGMAGLTMLGLALFYLIFILTKDFSVIRTHMEKMSGHMAIMEENFTVVSADVNRMQNTLLVLNDSVRVMPQINQTVGSMDNSLMSLSTDLHTITGQMDGINANVANMTANLHLLNQQFADMNLRVGHMAGNVNQMAKPIKMLPFP